MVKQKGLSAQGLPSPASGAGIPECEKYSPKDPPGAPCPPHPFHYPKTLAALGERGEDQAQRRVRLVCRPGSESVGGGCCGAGRKRRKRKLFPWNGLFLDLMSWLESLTVLTAGRVGTSSGRRVPNPITAGEGEHGTLSTPYPRRPTPRR